MKEHAKLYKAKAQYKQHHLSKRLSDGIQKDEEMKFDDSNVAKRKKGMDGKMISVPKG